MYVRRSGLHGVEHVLAGCDARAEKTETTVTPTVIDPSYQLLACRYLREQLDVLMKELRGVRANEDIEPVHQARVASRRMRAGLRMFADCFESKKLARWQKRVRKLTKGLGFARDRDVQIVFVERFLERLDAEDRRHRSGVKRFLLRLRQEREALQPKVLKTLGGLEKGNALAEMHGELAKIQFMLSSRDVQVHSPLVFERTAGHIRDRQRDLLVHEGTLDNPEDLDGHHRLRIAAKRLRYTMEICDRAYDGTLKPFIKAVKKVQSLLGDIHDCDVWVDDLDLFMERERLRVIDYFGHSRPFSRLKPGLMMLREDRRTHRERTFAELVAYWNELGEDGSWERLKTILTSSGPGSDRVGPNVPGEQSDGAEEGITDDRVAE